MESETAFAYPEAIIAIGSVTGQSGSTVEIPITFTSGAAESSMIQFELELPTGISYSSIAAGSAATLASKSVDAGEINISSDGELRTRVLVHGLNQEVIGNGTIALISFFLDESLADGDYDLLISEIVISDPEGNAVAGLGTNGMITAGDATSVQFTLSPANNLETNSPLRTFYCNVSGNDLSGSTLRVYRPDRSLLYNNTRSASGSFASNSWTVSLTPDGLFLWSCSATDLGSQSSSVNRTITVDSTAPTINRYSPSNTTYSSNSTSNPKLYLNFTVSDTNPVSCSYSLNNAANISIACSEQRLHLASGTYNLTLYSVDSYGNLAITRFSFTISDSTAPFILASSPSGTLSEASTATISVTTDESATCRYEVRDANYTSMTASFADDATSHAATAAASNGVNNFYVRCRDLSGNTQSTSTLISFSIPEPAVPGGGGSGGGGGGGAGPQTPTYVMTSTQLETGFTRTVPVDGIFKVPIGTSEETVAIQSVKSSSIMFTISSAGSLMEALSISEEKAFDINRDGNADFIVRLNSINDSKANITISAVSLNVQLTSPASTSQADASEPQERSVNFTEELIQEKDNNEPVFAPLEEEEKIKTTSKTWKTTIWIAIILLVIGAIVVIFLSLRRKKPIAYSGTNNAIQQDQPGNPKQPNQTNQPRP